MIFIKVLLVIALTIMWVRVGDATWEMACLNHRHYIAETGRTWDEPPSQVFFGFLGLIGLLLFIVVGGLEQYRDNQQKRNPH